MPKKTKRIKIVFFDVCWSATKFSTQAKAEKAAEKYSQQVRYQCEAFSCDKEHPPTSQGVDKRYAGTFAGSSDQHALSLSGRVVLSFRRGDGCLPHEFLSQLGKTDGLLYLHLRYPNSVLLQNLFHEVFIDAWLCASVILKNRVIRNPNLVVISEQLSPLPRYLFSADRFGR